ncbi:MAG: ribonuclease E/G [Tissierellia bacterium]|nr:ribonuclease E/G [Tissierellia bacterium]
MMKYVEIQNGTYIYTFFYTDRLIKITKEDVDSIPVDSIVHGRVKKLDSKMGYGFVDIGQEEDAYLNTKNLQIKSGQDYFFNIRRIADDEKGYMVDDDIKVFGEYAILLPNRRGVKNTKAMKHESRELQALEKHLGMGFILRTKTRDISLDALRNDLYYLKEIYDKLSQEKHVLPIPKIIKRSMRPAEKYAFVKGAVQGSMEDLRPLLKEAMPYMTDGKIVEGESHILVDVKPHFSFFDINTGRYSIYSERERNRWEVNSKLMETVLRIIELRNLEGTLLIDLLKMKKEQEERFIHSFLPYFQSIDVSFHDITALGIMELTRKKNGGESIREEDILCWKEHILS